MKFLVTGGAGFIGSNIVKYLIEKNEKVRVLDNFSTGKRENLTDVAGKIELVEGDIRSYHIVNQVVKGIDVILHQAALPSVPRSINDPITSNEVNIVGTLNVLEAAVSNKVKRFVFASSSSVYGDSNELPKNESMTPNPLSPYAVSKLAGENYAKVFSKIYGLETVCLRYFNVFGPNQDPNSEYSAVIPKFIKLINNNINPTIYGDGSQSRDFTYVDNVVEANYLAATTLLKTPAVMNCACHNQITLLELVQKINLLLNKNINPIFSDKKPGDIKHSFADISLINKSLNWIPKYDFLSGLSKLLKLSIKNS